VIIRRGKRPKLNSGTPTPVVSAATQSLLVGSKFVLGGQEGGATHFDVVKPKVVPGGHVSTKPDWQISCTPPEERVRLMPDGQERSAVHNTPDESRAAPVGQKGLDVEGEAMQTDTPDINPKEKPEPHIGSPKQRSATGSSVVPVGQFPLVGTASQKATSKNAPAGQVGSAPLQKPWNTRLVPAGHDLHVADVMSRDAPGGHDARAWQKNPLDAVPDGQVGVTSHALSAPLKVDPAGHSKLDEPWQSELDETNAVPVGQVGGASHWFSDESNVVPGGQVSPRAVLTGDQDPLPVLGRAKRIRRIASTLSIILFRLLKRVVPHLPDCRYQKLAICYIWIVKRNLTNIELGFSRLFD
jgi:hypothetical protein